MLPQWQPGIVRRIEQATPNTRLFWLELPETEAFSFKPGQFVTLDLPIHEQRNKRWRSYSIASAPNGGNVLELVISYMEGGAASQYIFSEIREGSTFTLRGPQGIFTLPEPLDKPLFMVCTGTGIAPFRSMLQHIQAMNIPHGDIHLIFGTRTQQDLLYADEMRALEQTLPGFHYYPTLSREQWEGRKGYVHLVYEELCIEKPDALFLLCGWRAMIDEARDRLHQLGYDKHSIHLELYG